MMTKVVVTGLDLLGTRFAELARTDALPRAAYAEMRRVWALAAQAFVRAALRQTLVDTGMSAATFWPLSRAISALRVGVVGTPGDVRERVGQRRRIQVQDRPEFPSGARRSPPRWRSAREGEREGRRAYSLTFGTIRRPRFRFFFQTVVFHFALVENQRIQFGASALQAGERAFLEVLDANLGRDLNDILRLLLNGRRLPADAIGRIDTLGNDV